MPRGPPLFDEGTKVVEQAARYAEAVRNWFIVGAVLLTISVCVLAVTYVDEWLLDFELQADIASALSGSAALWAFSVGERNLTKLQTLLRLTIRST